MTPKPKLVHVKHADARTITSQFGPLKKRKAKPRRCAHPVRAWWIVQMPECSKWCSRCGAYQPERKTAWIHPSAALSARRTRARGR